MNILIYIVNKYITSLHNRYNMFNSVLYVFLTDIILYFQILVI